VQTDITIGNVQLGALARMRGMRADISTATCANPFAVEPSNFGDFTSRFETPLRARLAHVVDRHLSFLRFAMIGWIEPAAEGATLIIDRTPTSPRGLK
jgi:hypothetical protein